MSDGRLRLKCDGTRTETRFCLWAKRTRNRRGRQFTRLLAAQYTFRVRYQGCSRAQYIFRIVTRTVSSMVHVFLALWIMAWYLQADFFLSCPIRCSRIYVWSAYSAKFQASQIWLLRTSKASAVCSCVYLVIGTSDGRSVSGAGRCCWLCSCCMQLESKQHCRALFLVSQTLKNAGDS
jgi:hypothetical protein